MYGMQAGERHCQTDSPERQRHGIRAGLLREYRLFDVTHTSIAAHSQSIDVGHSRHYTEILSEFRAM